MPFEHVGLAGGGLPDPGRRVRARSCDASSIAAEGNRDDRVGVAAQHPQLLTRAHDPETRGLVGASGDEATPIAAERKAHHSAVVAQDVAGRARRGPRSGGCPRVTIQRPSRESAAARPQRREDRGKLLPVPHAPEPRPTVLPSAQQASAVRREGHHRDPRAVVDGAEDSASRTPDEHFPVHTAGGHEAAVGTGVDGGRAARVLRRAEHQECRLRRRSPEPRRSVVARSQNPHAVWAERGA